MIVNTKFLTPAGLNKEGSEGVITPMNIDLTACANQAGRVSARRIGDIAVGALLYGLTATSNKQQP